MSSPPRIHVTAVTISPEPGKRSKHLSSGELRIGPHRYILICDNGSLCQEFQNVIELTPDTRIALHYKTSSLFSVQRIRRIDTGHLFANFSANQTQNLSVSYDGIHVVFSCQTTNSMPLIFGTVEDVPLTTDADGNLSPTINAILEDCPRFRILVIGKTGVGKSSLIHTAFGIDEAHSSDFVRGRADIQVGLKSVVNERFILHDSLGFEPADDVNYDTVKKFIQSRQTGPLKDQLHAIWFCVPVPRAGARLLEAAAEDFFRAKKHTMVPIIVVYTMLDLSVEDCAIKLASSHPELDEEDLTKLAITEAESSVQQRHNEIGKLAGEPLSYAIISTKAKYEYTFHKLVGLTYDRIERYGVVKAQIPSGIALIAAQRVDPHLKIKGTIDVGRQRYWKALRTSPAFQGHTIWDCLSVIHTDIVAVWNFNDPAYHLSDKKFKELVVKMAEGIETHGVSQPTGGILAMGSGSLVAAISGVLGAISNPAAPIVLPIVAGLTIAVWLYGVYRSAKNVQQIFIAYIVDLTHILETLSILTAHNHKELTRRTIKLAYHTYHDSGLMMQAHGNIQKYRELDGRDAALEMVEDLIKPERYGNTNLRNYYAEISMLDLAKFNLDQEEEW